MNKCLTLRIYFLSNKINNIQFSTRMNYNLISCKRRMQEEYSIETTDPSRRKVSTLSKQ